MGKFEEQPYLQGRLWAAAIDASQVQHHVLVMMMENPDPVSRKQALRKLVGFDGSDLAGALGFVDENSNR
jgi:hypothetical protein